ncbi:MULTISPECIES: SDR family oxidoreductase [unclassified Nocardioides]|uniref:SDR family oxidoreductase n=1 Tax=unclassified Nocardioides TaxID=2615069 RepID=UPI0007014519|nr:MULTISPECIES: SDR family oxidoreductase [unclassified Nocardioides]KQY64187.1 NAD(P)-dependent oxidoreductase [Nocardioides sp. Root140]KQZ70107.1 NAD(P)-dependent oxidoreductase [Nocardioides sp. Root151]KRF16204.1 NAD(P)-dependent oxidoreductase [Nocardioides sp. Soil796]
MSYIVIGATGQLGTLTVDALLDRGAAPHDIVAAGRNADRLAALAARGVHTRSIDLSDPASLADLFSRDDTVLLISGNELGQRVVQHGNVIDAAKAAGVKRLVYTSAPKADDTALVLAPEHKATEELIAASGLPATILRNGWYTENYLQAAEQARQTGVLLTSAGEGRISSASRSDYAEAAAVVLLDDSTAGRTFELSGDTSWDQQELADAIGQATGREVALQSVTPDEHQRLLVAAGLDEGTAGFVVALDGNTRDGLLGVTNGELSALIGHPTTPLVDGLRAGVAATV